MPCGKKKHKPMIPLKTLDIIFRRRNLPNTQYYFTNRKHGTVKTVPSGSLTKPFRIPTSQKLLSYIKYSDHKEKLSITERLNKPLHLKDNFRIAAARDISQRLHVKEPEDDVRAVVEIHPEFYTVIEGRPLRTFDDIKVYLNNIRNYAMARQQTGYRKDLIIKLDQNMIEEEKDYNVLVDYVKLHIKNFQKFLTEDYKKACSKVSKAEKVYQDLKAKTSEFLGHVSCITILNNVLFKLDSIRNTLKIYRRYLLHVAPLSWRQQYDETISGRVRSVQFETGEFATDNDVVDSTDIEKIVDMAKAELSNPPQNVLYFTDPSQMMYLFRTLELQSREYLIQLALTDIPYRLMLDKTKQLKDLINRELEYFQYYIDNINNTLERQLYNENHLKEKFFRILNNSFFDSVASPESLKLQICIEFVYEQIYGKCDEGHVSIHDPMKILEVMFEDYNLLLDGLDFKTVNQARNDCFEQDLKMMQNAYKAQRELRAFREMTNAMNKAFLPPAKFKRPVLGKFVDRKTILAMKMADKKKSEMLMQGITRPKPKKYKLTPEEREDLLLFTEYCEGLNPAPFLEDYNTYIVPSLDWVPRKSIN